VGDAVTAEEEAALDAELQTLRARAVAARTAAAELRRERASLQNELAQHGTSSVRTRAQRPTSAFTVTWAKCGGGWAARSSRCRPEIAIPCTVLVAPAREGKES